MLKQKILIGILFLALTGCGGDSSTGPDQGEPPQVPNLESAQPDVSFFENNAPKTVAKNKNSTTNYYNAQRTVMGQFYFFAIGQVYSSFFTQAGKEDAEFNNGQWEWVYSANYEGNSLTIRTTAKEVNDAVEWAMFWSFKNGEESIENYKMLEGYVSNDGSELSWTFNSMNSESNEEVPMLRSDWNITSENKKEGTVTVYSEGSVESTIDYSQDTPNFSMSLNNGEVIIEWNSETNKGFVTNNGEKQCWDSNFQDITCS